MLENISRPGISITCIYAGYRYLQARSHYKIKFIRMLVLHGPEHPLLIWRPCITDVPMIFRQYSMIRPVEYRPAAGSISDPNLPNLCAETTIS